MRFGLFGGARTDPGEQASDSRIYSDYIDYICEAEELGFHSVFLVEHHFTGFGQVSATLNFLTYLAAKTTKMMPASSGPGDSKSESINAARVDDGDISRSVSLRWFFNCIGRAHVLFRLEVLPVAYEVFLREHRYRDVVFCIVVRKSALQNGRLGKGCRRCGPV